MAHQRIISVQEIGSARLKLRSDLVFTPRITANQPYYLIEDPLSSRFYRIGHVEYTFISLLDGKTTVAAAMVGLCEAIPNHHLSEEHAAGLCRWLLDTELAYRPESPRRNDGTNRQERTEPWHPLMFRVPLFRPDRLLEPLKRYFGWLFSPIATIGWIALVTSALYKIAANWDRFIASSRGIFAPDNWIWLGVCWLGLKIVHEISHGIVCKRYGGGVREIGILFVLLAPLAYIDVTSSWRFRSRWQRIHVAAAGMYTELLIASIAALAWCATGSDWLKHLCFNVIVMASVTTIVFNANPLMRFDGYYILSDFLALPNLATNGNSYLRCWSRRYLLGLPATLPAWPRPWSDLIRVYGFAAFTWRLFVYVSLTLAAAVLFQGAGIVLAALAILLWFGLPALRFAKYLVWGKPGEQPRRGRFLLVTAAATGLCFVTFGLIRWPGARTAAAVVEYSPETAVRAGSSGFVRKILVSSGQRVDAGQLVLVLENRRLARDAADLQLQIGQCEIRARRHEQKGELAAKQSEMKHRESLQTKLKEKIDQLNQLSVRAPSSGKVVCGNLDSLIGTFVNEGDQVASIGNESSKQLRMSIAQDDLEVFIERVGKDVCIDIAGHPLQFDLLERMGGNVCIDIAGHPLQQIELEKVTPRATSTVPHPALAAINGGPLNVRIDPTNGESDSVEMLQPQFTAIAKFGDQQSQEVHAGQVAYVTYRPFDQSIGGHLYRVASRWINDQLNQKPAPGS